MNVTDLRARYAVSEEPLRSERRVELAVLILAALVLSQLLWLFASYLLPARVEVVRPAPDSMEVEAVGRAGTLTSAQSRSIRARPVFWESRRPLDPVPGAVVVGADEKAEAPAAENVLKGLTLSGIVANDGESRVIVTYKGEQQRLAPGQDIAGWTLLTVRPDEAVFEDSGREVVLRLRPRPVIVATKPTATAAGAVEAQSVRSRAAQALQRRPGEMSATAEKATEEEAPRLSLGG